MNKSIFLVVVFTCMAFFLSGCFGNNGNTKVANVALTSMSAVEGQGYQAGQMIEVDFVTQTQVLETKHVGVTFMLIQREKVAELETSEDPDGYELGEHYIEQLQEGEQSHTAQLLIPNEDLTPGEYVIAAYVDAASVIPDEANTEDNRSRGIETGDEETYSSVEIVEGIFHDFVLDSAKVGDGFALFPGPGKGDTSGTGSPLKTQPDLIGFIKATKYGSEVNSGEITATLTIGGTEYVAHLWNEAEQKYAHSMPIVFPDHEQSHFIPWDIGVNGTLLKAIHDNFDPQADKNTFTITFEVHDASAYVEASDINNILVVEVPYMLFHDEVDSSESSLNASNTLRSFSVAQAAKSTTSLSKVASWSATYGDSDVVAISPSFYSHIYLTSANNGYAEGLAEGDFDLYLFEKDFSLLSANAEASANVADGEIDYSVDFSVLGESLLSRGDTLTALDESFGYDWSEEQTIVSASFTIVIVPVTVKAGVSGNLGLAVGLSYADSRIDLGGDLVTASLDAYATAEINLGVASGGVGVDFLIISDTFNATVYADLTNAISSSNITYGIDVTNDIEAISGEFYIYVKYPKYKWCCTIKTKTKTQTLYETDSLYDKSWTILDQSGNFGY